MKLKAYSKVILSSGKVLKHEIVEFDDDGTPLRHFPLREELPFVEWHDETYLFHNDRDA